MSIIQTARGARQSGPTVYNVTVNPLPVPTITGNASACVNSTGNVYTTEAGMTGYTWALTGGTITAGGTATDNTATVTWTSTGVKNISVGYTNGNTCTSAAPTIYNVTVNPLPVPTITGNSTACEASTLNVYSTEPGMTGYVWTVSAGGTITAGGGAADNTATVTWTTPGPQTISVNYTNANGCTAASPTVKSVTVNPLPVPTITGNALSCAGSTGNVYTTESGMSNYTWVVSAGGTITAGGTVGNNTVTVTWNTVGAQSVSVKYTNGNGCTAAAATVFNVTVNALPVPTITGPASACVNSTGNLYTTEAGMTGYIWSVSAGGLITAGGTGNSSVTVTWTTVGARSVSVNYLNANSCMAAIPTMKAVTVNPLPTPSLSGNASACVTSTGNLYTTEAGMTGYTWVISAGGTLSAGGGATDNTATVTWTTTGPQTVSVNYTDGSGCTAASPVVKAVTVNPLPVPTITGNATACATSTGNIYTTEAGMTNYLWTVSGGGTITAGGGTGSNTVTITWNTAGAQSVSVNYTNGNGCTAAAATVYNVTVNALPVPALAGPASVCVGSAGNVYTTDPGMSNYVWSVPIGGTITAGGSLTNSITVTWTSTGARTVSVNYTNGSGCTAATPTTFNVTVNPLPIPTLTGPSPVCVNSTGHLYTTEAGMTGYTWVITGGTLTAGGTATDNTATVTWTSTGAQTISVNYTNGNGCTAISPTVKTVTVNPLPVPTITGPLSACLNSSGNVYTTEAGMTAYSWVVPAGGTITAGGGATNNTVTVTWNATGPQTVSVVYTNGSGCTAAAPTVYNVTVNALPVPTITGPASVCKNSTGNIYTTEAGMSSYIWTVSAGGTITAGGAGSNTVTVTWNTSGPQTVSVNYNNLNNCTAATATVYNVTVNPLPVPVITGPAAVCVTSAGNVYTTAAGMTGYTWTVSGGGTITAGGGATNNTVTVTWNSTGLQNVMVNYTDANGCTASGATSYGVTVNPLPLPTITGNASACVTSTGNIYTTEAGMTGYTWVVTGGTITAGGGATNNTATVTWNTVGAQTISVNYTNGNGCTAASPTVKTVTVNPLPVPTITGNAAACVNSTGNSYSTETGMSNYIWVVSAGGTITAGGGVNNNTVFITWNTCRSAERQCCLYKRQWLYGCRSNSIQCNS